jgi:hypothetical protein
MLTRDNEAAPNRLHIPYFLLDNAKKNLLKLLSQLLHDKDMLAKKLIIPGWFGQCSNAVKNLTDTLRGKRTDFLFQLSFIHRKHLRDID